MSRIGLCIVSLVLAFIGPVQADSVSDAAARDREVSALFGTDKLTS